VQISDPALRTVINDYTREAGVRNLEREIGTVFRKIARRIAEEPRFKARVKPETIVDYLSRPRFYNEVKKRTASVGVTTGLAWTPVGGDIMFIETTAMPGSGKLVLTGQLGDVMKESAQAAVSFLRSRSGELGLQDDYFSKHDLHIHVPAGATPKDGPSAGIALATSIASLLTNTKVDSNLAMTGEITLTGQVLPIGGLKEKVLGAKRAGINKIVLPKRNESDLDDVPKEVRDTMTFVPVEEISEVFEQAFGKRIITPVMLGEPPPNKDGVVVPMRRSAKRPAAAPVDRKRAPARRASAVSTRKR
jgi:ATP-dependent Lon protease